MNNTNYLSIAISASFIRYALFDESGSLKVKKQVPTPTDSVENFLKQIYEIVTDHLKSIYGIGLSVPGQVDQKDGVIYQGGSLPMLHGLSLGKILATRYELPVSMESTGFCVTLASQWNGNLKGVTNGATIALDDGVSSGLVLNHQIFSGSHLQAGGIGMIIANPTVENHQPEDIMFNACSASKMINTIGSALELSDPNDDIKVFKAIENGDANAREMFNAYCRNVAYMIVNTQAVLDLNKYVISGRISNQSILVPEINHQIQIIRETIPALKEMLEMPVIETSIFKQDTDLFGAFYNALDHLDFTQPTDNKAE